MENNIWNDAWIPASPNGKVYTPRRGILLAKVSELINPINGKWDEGLIRTIFYPIDANRILNIPLANQKLKTLLHGDMKKMGYIQ